MDTEKKSTKKVVKTKESNIHTKMFAMQKEEITIPRKSKGFISGREYFYANLDDILAIIRPLLNKHEILMSQSVENNIVSTWFTDPETGTGTIPTKINLNNYHSAQDMGSWITYARRYGIVTALGISTDTDVDGVKDTTPTSPVENSAPVEPTVTGTQTDPEPQDSAFQKVVKAIEGADLEALNVLSDKITSSEKLTDSAKEFLLKSIADRKFLLA